MWRLPALLSSFACPLWLLQWESGRTRCETLNVVIKDLGNNKTMHHVFYACLFFLDDIDPSLHIGEGVYGGEDCLPLVLLVEFTSWTSALGKGSGVHEAPQVEVLLEVCESVFHFIIIKVRLHVGDLDVSL